MLSFLFYKGGMKGIRRDRMREKDRDGRENESDKEKQVKKKRVDGRRETEKKKGERESEQCWAALCLSSPFDWEERDWRPIVEIPFLTVLSDLINAGSPGTMVNAPISSHLFTVWLRGKEKTQVLYFVKLFSSQTKVYDIVWHSNMYDNIYIDYALLCSRCNVVSDFKLAAEVVTKPNQLLCKKGELAWWDRGLMFWRCFMCVTHHWVSSK